LTQAEEDEELTLMLAMVEIEGAPALTRCKKQIAHTTKKTKAGVIGRLATKKEYHPEGMKKAEC
jgi:hypothetical protein